jgi:hypothetical protein
MRALRLIAFLASAILTGCDPMAIESLTLQLPSGTEAETAKTALTLIEQVMKEHDFRPIKIGSEINDSTLVAVYGDAVEDKLGCFVYHRKSEIEIEFKQFGVYKLHPVGTRAKDDLRRKLIDRFGKVKASS